MSFAVSAYIYDPTHKLMIYHWLPYVIFGIVWIISIFLIDIGVAQRYKDGTQMFNSMLAGFTNQT